MKFKRIWIVIYLILILGITSTNYIKKVTSKSGDSTYESLLLASQQTELMSQDGEHGMEEDREAAEISENPLDLNVKTPEEKTLENREKEAFTDANKNQEIHQNQQPQKTSKPSKETDTFGFHLATASEADGFRQSDGSMSEALGSRQSVGITGQKIDGSEDSLSVLSENVENEEKKLQNTALARLQELDSQIARNRAEDTDMTANSQRAAAESEWRLWETELQRLMEILKEKLDRTQQDTLMRQQREWIRSREEQAVEISRKQMGSAMEEVSYSRALAELTRERSYQVAEMYADLFAP